MWLVMFLRFSQMSVHFFITESKKIIKISGNEKISLEQSMVYFYYYYYLKKKRRYFKWLTFLFKY